MSFFFGGYPQELKDKLEVLLEIVKPYDGELWVGDCYGPQRTSASIKVNVVKNNYYIIFDPNADQFRVGVYRSSDVDASEGVVLDTHISDIEEISYVVKELLAMIEA